jgi:hypothetical protein
LSGWDVGVQVSIKHEDGKDVIYVRKTGGSNNTTENTSNLYNLDELIAGAK